MKGLLLVRIDEWRKIEIFNRLIRRFGSLTSMHRRIWFNFVISIIVELYKNEYVYL